MIPRQSPKRAGPKAPAEFFVDNALYVFGQDLREKPFSETDVRLRASWFREKVQKCAEETGDDGARAVLAFLKDVAAGKQKVMLPEAYVSNELFAFIYADDVDRLVTDREKGREYWKRLRQEGQGEASDTRCLVSGRQCVPTDTHPAIKGLAGASSAGAALVSFNKGAFESYGWHRNENAPVSREAAEACGTALNRLLDYAPQAPDGRPLPRRNLPLPGDTVVCYWAPASKADDFLSSLEALLEADAEQVRTLYRSIWRGKPPEIRDPSAFYVLTLSGSQGRAIVRGWFESTVETVAANLTRYFEDLDIVRNTPKPKDHDLPPQLPLRVLLRSLAPLGKDDAVPAPLAADVVAAAFRGTPLPLAVLQRAIERARAEIGHDDWADLERRDARAALIKAVLNRRKRFHPETTSHYREVKHDMDATNNSPGYVLGRLMAILERLQQEALGDPNASVIDRFFSGASACPKAVFVRLLRNARHHVRKAQDDPKRAGFVFLLDRLIDEHADQFDPRREPLGSVAEGAAKAARRVWGDPRDNGFPASLSLDDQGLFVLGYHQMRKWLWMTQDQRAAWEADNPDAPPAFRWGKAK